MMHPLYLPFTEEQLVSHFADVRQKGGKCNKNVKQLEYYKQGIERYTKYLEKNPNRRRKPLKELKYPCQIEKDERFWIVACMMTIFYSQNRRRELIKLFRNTYGDCPIKGLNSWGECFGEDLHLFFEPNLPSPTPYKEWLQRNLTQRQFIPYVLDSAYGKVNLEGATNVDAMLLNSKNGFAVIIEAKVLSDISYEITYDTMRNQIARNIDVMLEENMGLCHPLDKRDPEKTLFLLITPKLFKEHLSSRLYGYKLSEYKNNPNSLANDLPHRKNCDWRNIALRLGWLTWKDFKNVNNDCCPWLK